MKLVLKGRDFHIGNEKDFFISQTKSRPLLFAGYGQQDVRMHSGNFKIKDYVEERCPLEVREIVQERDKLVVNFSGKILMTVETEKQTAVLRFVRLDEKINRFWIRLDAGKNEKVYGCGEQYSYFNLRGRNFPLWSSEPGVGRDKKSFVTYQCDRDSESGGDYYNTYFPQQTFVSSRHYFCHVDSTAYADFDFTHPDFHELMFWDVPKSITLTYEKTFPELLTSLTALLGRQEELPDWAVEGAILGLQGGTDRVRKLTERSIRNGIRVTGLFCQDWEGIRMTSFGKRLEWDWHWNEKLYPDLPDEIRKYNKAGIRFMGYINPYLVQGGMLFAEAEKKGYFIRQKNGKDYLIDCGEFFCGMVDLTNPEAFQWYKEVIKKYMIRFGLSGWMADFGEYLPADAVLCNGESALIEHNHWPALWAKCNYEAVKESGKLGDVVYFMRSGAAGSQKYSTLAWNGDQSVDLSIHDGLISAVCGTLSLAMSGYGLSHSDIGGYTSVYDNLRTKEVFDRWVDMAAFTPVMRTHEGNRPSTNFQYYDDADSMENFARMTAVHYELRSYIKAAVRENHLKGIPVQRPLFLHYENDAKTYDLQTEYLFGRDLLVAPVYEKGADGREVYLPDDQWVGLWDGRDYAKGRHKVKAPTGYPPVFYRKNSGSAKLFSSITKKFGGYVK
ncbi:MAG: alpha-glucosidase [Lachnospiraceae bacterium]|jgi:alpha-glucosidase|nr:alpha-glucosidase [Lachnospiraceae bacterium]